MTESRRERERRARRQEILSAAKEVLSRKPFNEATLEEIAERAELAKGTIYGYFKNKEDLFISLIKQEFDSWRRAVEPALDEGLAPRERLRIMTEEVLRYHLDNLDLYKIYLTHMGFIIIPKEGMLHEYQRIINDCLKKAMEIYREVIIACQKDGLFKDKDPQFLTLVYRGVIQSVLMGWMMGLIDKPIPKLVEDILELLPESS